MGKKHDALDQVIHEEKRKTSLALTPLRQAFVREYITDPRNATRAAIRAGYAPKNASVTAHRLLRDDAVRSALARHFLDMEELLSETLAETLLRLKSIVNGPKNETAIRAAKTLLHYTKIANDVLGLKVKVEEKFEPQVTMTRDELVEFHRRELEHLEHLKEMDEAQDNAVVAVPATVQH